MPKSTAMVPKIDSLAHIPGDTTLAKVNNFLGTKATVQDDPTETMLQAILTASNPADWERVFTANHFAESATQRWRIHDYRTAESQFEGDLKYFLVLDITDLKSGERTVATCGSLMAIGQILNAEARGMLPIDVEVVRKDKPTKAGFYPMRLRFLGSAGAPLGDPATVVSEQ